MKELEVLQDEVLVCADCGCVLSAYDIKAGNVNADGDPICIDCGENYYTCDDCGEVFYKDDGCYLDNYDRFVCYDCLNNHYSQCCDCGDWFEEDDLTMVENEDRDNFYVCEDCLNNNYYQCEDCGRWYTDDCGEWHGDYWYCYDCRDGSDGVLDYHDFDDWQNHYLNNKYESSLKGFELEVDCGRYKDNNKMVSQLHDIADDFFVYEHDGSLDNGFEVISNPFTMPWLYSNKNMISRCLYALSENGYKSHDTTTCGLHIHVDRDYFSKNTDLTEDEVIDNIIAIVENFKDEIKQFSRRKTSHYCEYMSDKKTYNSLNDKNVIKRIKISCKSNRYVPVNLTNNDTIEFRMFRGTLNFKTLMASIELVDNIVEIAKGNINGLTWENIINYKGDYIKQYNASRGIVSSTVLEIVQNESVTPKGLLPIGTKIHIRSDLQSGYIEFKGYDQYVNDYMVSMAGNLVTIDSYIDSSLEYQYIIKEDSDRWEWSNIMFDQDELKSILQGGE